MQTDQLLLNSQSNHTLINIPIMPKHHALWQSYQSMQANTSMLFPTEAAKDLSVSELELLLSSPNSIYLGGNCAKMLMQLHQLAEVENIVRNEFAVHEKQAHFINLTLGEHMGMSLGQTDAGKTSFDLRLFMTHYKHILAIANPNGKPKQNRPSFCLAFFDEYGQAVNKVFLKDFTDNAIANWYALIEPFTHHGIQNIQINQAPTQLAWQYHALNANDLHQFHQQWQAMTDIHQFHKILSDFKLDRASSYQQAPIGCSQKVCNTVIESLFKTLKNEVVPVMIFVGNTGAIQIHANTLCHIQRMGNWLNVLDKKHSQFTLHLNDHALAQVWWIKRPNHKGYTTAFEAFDAKGNSILTLFGVRTKDNKQDERWQSIAKRLADEFTFYA